MRQACWLHDFSDKIIVKLPISVAGIQALLQLKQECPTLRLAVTVISSIAQAYLAGKAGADIAAVFNGPWDQASDTAQDMITPIKKIYANYGFKTKILSCGRFPRLFGEVAAAGTDICTMRMEYLRLLYEHPFTDKRMEVFADNWQDAFGNDLAGEVAVNVMQQFDLSGRVAIVTGGARVGWGGRLPWPWPRPAQMSHLRPAGDRGRSDMRRVGGAGPRSAFARVDVTQPAEIEAMIERVIAVRGKIDILVNNAGMPSDGLVARGRKRRRLAAHDRHQPVQHVLLRQAGRQTFHRARAGRRDHQHRLDQQHRHQQYHPAP